MKLIFLDLTIIKLNNSLKTKWHKKDIASNRLLNYYSNHPSHMKQNTIKNLINKALLLTDSPYLNEIKNKLKIILIDNLYPLNIINKLINNFNKQTTNKTQNNQKIEPIINEQIQPSTSTNNNVSTNLEPSNKPCNENKIKPLKQSTLSQFIIKKENNNKPVTDINIQTNKDKTNKLTKNYVSIPYIKGFTENIKKTFKDYDIKEIKIASKPINKINDQIFSKLKDKIPEDKQTCLVYQINCTDCNKIYIGQTKQYIKNRINQHKSNTTSKIKAQNEKTALSKHSTQLNHKFNFNQFKILEKEANRKKREFKESLHISLNNHNTINDKTDMKNLNLIYASTLNKLKNNNTHSIT